MESVRTRRTITVSIVSDLVIVPNRNPGESLMTEKKIKIGSVRSYPLPVVIKCEDLRRFRDQHCLFRIDIAFGEQVSNLNTNYER